LAALPLSLFEQPATRSNQQLKIFRGTLCREEKQHLAGRRRRNYGAA
jgi:hypothetical protein